MNKFLRILGIGVVCLILMNITVDSSSAASQNLYIVCSTIFSVVISSIYELIDTHGQGIKTWFLTQVRYRNETIRLSFAYLFRIEVDGKFLLVRGHRMRNQYQPIGGVYKVYDEGRSFLNGIRAVTDTSMGNSDETDDLRLKIKGKDYFKFWDWFISMKDREYDPRREFEEELIESGILPQESFKKLKYRKVFEHNVGVTYSQPLDIYEVVYADIFEVKLSDMQKAMIREAVRLYPEQICLASPEEMKTRRYGESVEMNLGNNTPWLLGEDGL